jgi:hypothetical protein
MKKFAIMVIALALLVTGFAMADPGIKPVPETQGISTSTTVDAVGNIASDTDLQWLITDTVDVRDITALDGTVYSSSYSEKTQSHGIGLVLYDKETDVETAAVIAGLSNVEATKQIAFAGIDGARIVSSDKIFVDGAGTYDEAAPEKIICPFYDPDGADLPTFCNRAEAGSTIDMTIANVRTTSNDRFIMPAGDYQVELNHDILVSELVEDLPSMGTASAYMNVLIQESRADSDDMFEKITFVEETTVTGDISTFEKLMHYESGIVR